MSGQSYRGDLIIDGGLGTTWQDHVATTEGQPVANTFNICHRRINKGELV